MVAPPSLDTVDLTPSFCWTKLPKKDAKFETKSPKIVPKFAPKFAPKFWGAAFLAGRKVLPPNFTRYFTSEISNYKSNFIKKLHNALDFCRQGNANCWLTYNSKTLDFWCFPYLRNKESKGWRVREKSGTEFMDRFQFSKSVQMALNQQKPEWVVTLLWPSNPCFFWIKKSKGNPEKSKGFLFTEPLKYLQK